jgi:Fe-S-cluster-containing dehydrogenase component
LTDKAFFVDIDKCTNCDLCRYACSFIKEGAYDLRKSRIWIVRDESRAIGVPVLCEQCEDPPCAEVCPVRALTKDETTGIVELNENRCIGCKECMWACPFGAIAIDIEKGKPIKCDLCGGDPGCVKACLPGALEYSRVDRPTTRMRRKKSIMRRLQAIASMATGEAK